MSRCTDRRSQFLFTVRSATDGHIGYVHRVFRRPNDVLADGVAAAVCGSAGDFVDADVIVGHLPQVGCELLEVGGPGGEVGVYLFKDPAPSLVSRLLFLRCAVFDPVEISAW
jgi:hypothetical protein